MFPRKITPNFLKDAVEEIHDFAADTVQRVSDIFGAERDIKRTRVDADDDRNQLDEYPPKARYIDGLNFNRDLLAVKKSKKRLRVAADDIRQENPKEYHFKKKRIEMDDGGVELEAYSGAVCEFLAGKNIVAASRPYYSDDGYVGSASKNLPNFKTNHSDPLRLEDTVISVIRGGTLRSGIDAAVKEVCAILSNKNRSGMLAGLKRKMGSLFEQQEMTANYFHHFLQQYLNNDNRFDDAALVELFSAIHKRQNLIESKAEAAASNDEIMYLSQLQNLIASYTQLEQADRRDKLSVSDLEDLDRYLIENKIDVHQVESVSVTTKDGEVDVPARDIINYRIVRNQALTLTARYILKEADCHNQNFSKDGAALDFGMAKFNISYHLTNQTLPVVMFKKPLADTFKCTERDLRAFPHLRDAAPFHWPTKQTRASKLLMKAVFDYLNGFHAGGNQDAVSRHVTDMVDWAVSQFMGYQEAQAPFLTKIAHGAYSVIAQVQAALANKSVDEYKTEQYRREVLTVVGGLIETYLAEHHEEFARLEAKIDEVETDVLKSTGHFASRFSEEDNLVFKGLASHPVFIFHKFKILLKYILTDKSIYTAMTGLYISPQRIFQFIDGYEGKRVDDVVANDEAERIIEISNVLYNLPEFKQFLEHDGRLALEMIRREFVSYCKKYNINPPVKSEEYRQFAKALHEVNLDERYENVLTACGIGGLASRLSID